MAGQASRPSANESRSVGRELHNVAAETIHQAGCIEIQQQADPDAAHAEIGAQLHLVHRQNRRNRLDFQDKLLGHDNIRLETVPDLLALIEHRNGDLSYERNARPPQLDAQTLFIDRFKQAGARVAMHLDGQSDDLFGQFPRQKHAAPLRDPRGPPRFLRANQK